MIREWQEAYDSFYSDHQDFYFEAALRYLISHGFEIDDALDVIDSSIKVHHNIFQTSITNALRNIAQD